METLLNDLRYAVRVMLKSPGFTAVAILSLALGIGANTSIFSVVNTMLLKPLPYENPDRLAQLFREYENPQQGLNTFELWSYPKFAAFRDHNESFEQVAAVSDQNFPITDTDNPERLSVELVSATYFPLLGIQPKWVVPLPLRRIKLPAPNPLWRSVMIYGNVALVRTRRSSGKRLASTRFLLR